MSSDEPRLTFALTRGESVIVSTADGHLVTVIGGRDNLHRLIVAAGRALQPKEPRAMASLEPLGVAP